MFSNITEAWGNDPVKEMTNKLSNGVFKTDTEQSEIFNFNKRKNTNQKKSISSLSLSDANSLNLLSDNNTLSLNNISSDFSPYARVNFNKNRNKSKHKKKIYQNVNYSESDEFSDSMRHSKCDYSIKHLKNCDNCYNKLKHLVNSKVNKKFDEIILENKMKQLQNISVLPAGQAVVQQPTPYVQNSGSNSDSWKEVLIIMVGAVIAIFIIFLIVKSLHK